MKYVPYIALFLCLTAIAQYTHAYADLTCIYKETTRTDVTKPAHIKTKYHKNATDIGCRFKCAENDTVCGERLRNGAQEYCEEFNRVPVGYSLFKSKIICEDNTVFEYDYTQE